MKQKYLKIISTLMIICLIMCLININKSVAKATQTLQNGYYIIKMKTNSNKAVDISGASRDNQANAHIWTYKGEIQQKFQLIYDGNGYYKIKNMYSGKVLDVEWGGMTAGTNVWQYEDNGTDSQKWSITKTSDGYYNVTSKLNGLNLDVADGLTTDGTNVRVWNKNNSDAQKFQFEAVESLDGSKTIDNGEYTITTILDKNKVIDISGASRDNQANVHIWTYKGEIQQKFKLEYDNKGYYKIKNVNSGKVLDVEWGRNYLRYKCMAI